MKFNRLFGILSIAILTITLSPQYSISTPKKPSSTIPSATSPTEDGVDYQLPTPEIVKKVARDITVRISSASNGGSGVLVAKKGNTYLVLTNRHVAGRESQFQIQTPDGQKHTAQPVKNTGINPKYDVALLQFTSPNKYQLATLKSDENQVNPLAIDRTLYSAGFPFDSNDLRFSVGEVSQLSDVPLDDGTQIGYKMNKGQKQLRQGMSGGPIIDVWGSVIGINTIGSHPIVPSYTYFDGSKPIAKLAAKYQQANWGVPIYNFLTQLDANILYGYENFPKVQRQVTPTGYIAKLNRETRQQTVRIETGTRGRNGSGVIVAKQGNTYYVLTAKHVVFDSDGKKLYPNITTITHDQEIYQIQPSEIKLAEGVDLAVVKFTSQTNYLVAKLGNYSPKGNAGVFAGGYPARENIDSPLWQWQLNPGGIENKEDGKFWTQDKNSFSNGYDLIYSSISYGGMSGGPILDTDGRVIGIHGKAEGQKRESKELILGKSLGISIQTFLGLTDRLQVPKLLKISSNSPANLGKQDRDSVIAVWDNIATPQAGSSGAQWIQYGNQLYRTWKMPEAALAFDKAIAQGREYRILGNYGKVLALGGGDNDKALSAIENAIDAVPPNQIERKRYYYLWKYQASILRLLGKYPAALRSIEIAINLEPSDPILLNEQAVILSNNKQQRTAIAIYDKIIVKYPESYVYNNRGVSKYDLGQKQAAITDYDRAIAINPNYSHAYNNRGLVKSDLGQNQSAITDYDRAIVINPNFAKAYSNRGNAKSYLGKNQAAIIDYDRAIAIDPNYAEAYNNRGVVKYDLGQKQAAITDYDLAIAIDPNYAGAYSNRGNAKLYLGQKQAAITDYDLAIDINRNYVEAYSNRGIAKFELGQNSAAILDLDRSIIINPNFADAYNNRGLLKTIIGSERNALPDLERAIQLNPKMSESYACRGFLKEIAGDRRGAIIDYKQAIASNPQLIKDWKKQAESIKKYSASSYQRYQQMIQKLEAGSKII
jgi:tetratricopeptide (TPR) repeat protein/S1-C subfamily serine protease